ncbi:hypothetical protein KUTeg_002072 [Tegillarca granosa]|uniref:RING-type E3 ubiquitin transferase n=1 Tax=Tegillarca granosa TaxID=220873 RepID=A0ABQ9FW21_TEGGR|nr:hypothetical protein KUTeg_002072 [Tegillarca granosa]
MFNSPCKHYAKLINCNKCYCMESPIRQNFHILPTFIRVQCIGKRVPKISSLSIHYLKGKKGFLRLCRESVVFDISMRFGRNSAENQWYSTFPRGLVETLQRISGIRHFHEIENMEVGLRVVRGPDWKWGNQDDGEGHVGTVVEIGKPGSSTSPDKTVVVQWDSGSRTNYRVGYQGAYDLRIYDNAPIGVKHPNIICDGCKKQGIQGMRFKCTKCHDFDLCSRCYMADKHDLGHSFLRFETSSSKGVKMSKRKDVSNSSKIQVSGIFGGSRVIRGPDWDWGNQDGGEGKVGKVTDVRGWDSESGRSVAHVTWSSGSTNVYRVGHKGKVDLKCITPAVGGYYYKEHLPVLGEFTETNTSGGVQCQFKVNDKYIGKVGTVHRITERGDVRVQYEGCSNRWTFHPGALTKVHVYSINDMVKISDNVHQVMELQKSHGEWTENMKYCLGRTGRVLKVYPDANMSSLLEQIMEIQAHDNGPDRLVREAAQGHTDIVKDIISKFPDKVDFKSSGKTALQVASHQGHKDIVQFLLMSTANNQADVMELLLKSGAQINSLNNGGCSTLHVAVNKQHAECVRILLRHRCNVNIQDSYGDTALHDAIGKENVEIMEMLAKNFNPFSFFSATEKILQKCRQIADIKKDDGFSALHLAALNGHKDVTNTLLTVGQADIEIRNNRQQTPLLLAVSQGHTSIIELLVTRGADVNVEDEDGDTCLHLALMRQSVSTEREDTPMLDAMGAAIACYLAQQGASLTKKNHQGKTPLDVTTDTRPASIKFLPCNHVNVCHECCHKMKKCLQCKATIEVKLGQGNDEYEKLKHVLKIILVYLGKCHHIILQMIRNNDVKKLINGAYRKRR